jgi:TRAP-type C4-dicarboxylate transport system substrate-binding protein
MNVRRGRMLAHLAVAAGVMFAASSAQAQQEPVVLKISDSFPKGHVIYDTVVDVLIPALEEGGKIKVQYFPANQLGAMKDVIESLRGGIADIAYVAPGVIAGRMPASNVLSLPGEFTSGEQLARVYMKMVESSLKPEYDKLGIKIITASGTPPYQIFTRDKLVKLPEDVKGLKLRGGGGDADDFLREIGVNVINMPASHMYESLQRGVIDGATYLHATAAANHLQEVTKNATEGAPLMSLLCLYFVDKKRWDSFSPEIQAIIKRAGEKMAIAMGQEYDRRDRTGKEIFLKAGGKVHVLTAEEVAAWKATTKDAAEKFLSKLEKRGFGYARGAYQEMQKLKHDLKS